MDQTKRQGDDYYGYGRSIRPMERAMMGDAFGVSSGDVSEYQGMMNQYDDARAQENFTAQQQTGLQRTQGLAASRAQTELDALNAQRTALAQTYQTQLQSAQPQQAQPYNPGYGSRFRSIPRRSPATTTRSWPRWISGLRLHEAGWAARRRHNRLTSSRRTRSSATSSFPVAWATRRGQMRTAISRC